VHRFRAAVAGVGVGASVAYLVLRFRPYRVEIAGPSMSPTLEPGDWALAVAARRVRRGDVVVLEHPERPGFELVKRVVAVEGDATPDGRILGRGQYWVEGDDPAASTDSRGFGPISRTQLKATVRLVYWPPSRRRLV
jgi:nickel-type superoxide dismutase maturation protease